MTIQIRIATQADVEDLVALETRLFVTDAGAHDPFVDTTWPERRGAADFVALLKTQKRWCSSPLTHREHAGT